MPCTPSIITARSVRGRYSVQVDVPGFEIVLERAVGRFDRAVLVENLDRMAARQAGLREDFRCEHGEVRYAEVGGFAQESRMERFVIAADLCLDLAEVAAAASPRRNDASP